MTCSYCGCQFVSTREGRKFCSHSCYWQSKKVRVPRTCEHCGNTFDTIPSELKKGPVRFCSRDCYWKSQPFTAENNHRWKGGTRTVICVHCRTSFERPLTWLKGQRYEFCGEACRHLFLKANPDKTPNWKGGVAVIHYGIRKHWTYGEWRKAVLKKDNYTCHKCGKRGGRLTAHHLYKFADYPHLRLSVENGHTMCRACHAAIKGKEYEYLTSIGLSPLQPPLF